LLLRRQVSELTLQLRHLQLPQLLELLHLLDADHVADLDRLHVPDRAVAERLELRECRILTCKLRTLQPGRRERTLDSAERIFAPLRVRARVVRRHDVAGVHLRELAAQISVGIADALPDLGDLRERIQVALNLSPDAVRNVLQVLHFVGELLKLIGDLRCLVDRHDLQCVQLGQRILRIVGRIEDHDLRRCRLAAAQRKRHRKRGGADWIVPHDGFPF
jgi:hypothetical protein